MFGYRQGNVYLSVFLSEMCSFSDLPVGDGLEEAPEERLRKGSSVSLPTPAPSLCADVLALYTMDEDGFQGRAEEVSVAIFTGDNCI